MNKIVQHIHVATKNMTFWIFWMYKVERYVEQAEQRMAGASCCSNKQQSRWRIVGV